MKLNVLMLEFYESGIPLSMRTVANYSLFNPLIEGNVDYKILDYQAKLEVIDVLRDTESLDEIIHQIEEFKPKVICFSIWLWNYRQVEVLSVLLANKYPEITFLLGGLGIFYPEEFLEKHKQFSMYCYGKQGEETFEDLMLYFLGNKDLGEIPGIYYWEEDNLIKAPPSKPKIDPDKLLGVWETFPPPGNLKELNDKGYSINLAYEILRGCMYKCPYCAWGAEVDKIFYKDAEKIISEINNLPDEPMLEIIDSIANTKKQLYILKNIKKTFSKILLTIDQRVYKKGTDEFIAILKQFKSVQVGIGIQSFDPKVTASLSRVNDWEILRKWSNAFKDDPKVTLDLQFILGLPYQTYEIAKRDIELGKTLGKVSISPLVVLPKSEFWDTSKSWGAVYMKEYPYTFIRSDYLSKDEVTSLIEQYREDEEISYCP